MQNKSLRVLKLLSPISECKQKVWMKRSVLITMQKVNILIYRLNKLENANMEFLLGFLQSDWEIYKGWWSSPYLIESEVEEVYRGIEVCYPPKIFGCEILFIFYLPVNQKENIWVDDLEVKYIYRRKDIKWRKIKCNYVPSQNGRSHWSEHEK